MFDIEVCEPRQIVLVRFHGLLGEKDFVALDRLAASARGGGKAFDCIYDMTNVEKMDLDPDFAVKRGEIPQAYKDHERIYVVPDDDLKLLLRLYSTYQANKGWKPAVIVRTLEEALVRLDVGRAEFQKVRLDPDSRPGDSSPLQSG